MVTRLLRGCEGLPHLCAAQLVKKSDQILIESDLFLPSVLTPIPGGNGASLESPLKRGRKDIKKEEKIRING